MAGLDPSLWRQLAPYLDEALDLAPSQRRMWVDSLQIDPELKSALQLAISRAEAPHPLLDGQISAASLLNSGRDGAEHWVGRQVGNWRITGFLGQGGMAAVFAAERARPPHQIGALKLMQRGLFTEFEREQFRREQTILAKLEHPGVARMIDAGLSDDGIPFLVMEPVDGRAIDRFAFDEKLSLRQRVELIARAGDIVAYAQRALVVHRDLKPEHILVTDEREIKILDFGIAKLIGDDRATRTYAHLGTPRYAAPEQVAGEAITTATDVYSLGTIARELVADCADKLPRDLDAVLAQACAASPEKRYPSAATLVADLRRWLEKRPVRARRIGPLARTARLLRRHWMPSAALAGIILSLLLGVVMAQREAARADRAADAARIAQRQAESALARAQSLNAFVVGLFRADVANVPRDQMPTTRQIVDAGVVRARNAEAGPPELRAEMLSTLSQIVGARAQFEEAQALGDEALALLQPIAEAHPSLYADALLSRAGVAFAQKRTDEAATLFARATEWTGARLPNSRLDLEARRESARVDSRRGNLVRAREQFESIDRELAAHPEWSDMRLKVATDLAIIHAHSGDMPRATAAFETVLALKRETDGMSTISIVSALNNLASARSLNGAFEASDRTYREALALLADLDDTPFQVRAAIAFGLSENAQRRGDFDTALALVDTAGAHWRDALSIADESADTFVPYHRGLILADAQRRDEAMAALLLAEQRLRDSDRPSPKQIDLTRAVRARLLCEQGKPAESGALLNIPPTPATADDAMPPWDVREAAARCLLESGDPSDALRWLGEDALVEHPLAVGLNAVRARRLLLRAAIWLQLQRTDAARRDIEGARKSLDAIGVLDSHPLRTQIATLREQLASAD